jgi:hypothetical protein
MTRQQSGEEFSQIVSRGPTVDYVPTEELIKLVE